MKIVISGAGNVGHYLVKMFSEKNFDVILIDPDKEKLQEILTHYDVMAIQGNSASFDILKEVEINKADLFISVTNYQDTNILSCILAKKLGAKTTIARANTMDYTNEQNSAILKNYGVDYIIFPELLVTDEIIKHLKYPNILKTLSFEKGKLDLISIKIKQNEDFNNKTIIEISDKFSDISARIVSIQRGDKTFIPYGKDKIFNDDIIYVITDKEGKEKILNLLGIQKETVKSLMILGGSKIGVNIAKRLQDDYYVKLFEKSREKSFKISDELDNTLVLHSEARDSNFLLDEGISRTDAFIAVTDNAEVNMLSCMLAKKLGVKKTFAEVENIDYLDIVRNTDIDYIINKKLVAAGKIFAIASEKDIVGMYFLTDTNTEVMEFITHKNAKITQKKLRDINFPDTAIIGGIIRDTETIIATGDTQVQQNDRVIVFTLSKNSDKLAKWFK